MHNQDVSPTCMRPSPTQFLRLGIALLLALTLATLTGQWLQPTPTHAQDPATPTPVPQKRLDKPLTTSVLTGDTFSDIPPEALDLTLKTAIFISTPVPLDPIADWFTSDGDSTRSIAWGDMDNDGDLDLAVGNSSDQPNKVYLNEGEALQPIAAWESRESDSTYSLAWGDMDGDGDLDLAVGNAFGQFNRIYLNDGGILQTSAIWTAYSSDSTYSVAWGDVDGDGDLDLVTGNWGASNIIYLNDGSGNFYSESVNCDTIWEWGAPTSGPNSAHSGANVLATNLAGNYSNDADSDTTSPPIDLSAYAGQSFTLSWWQYLDTEVSFDEAYVEVSNDSGQTWTPVFVGTGEVDLAWTERSVILDSSFAGGNLWIRFRLTSDVSVTDLGFYIDDVSITVGPTTVYVEDFEADDGGFDPLRPDSVHCFGRDSDVTRSIALGDIDRDGDLDLAVGNVSDANEVYRNHTSAGTVQLTLVWTGAAADETHSLALGDVDGDGDLDLAVGNLDEPNKLYLNDAGLMQSTPVWSDTLDDPTESLAWGDVDGDGDLDLAVGNGEAENIGSPNKVYLNNGGILETAASWESSDSDVTQSVAFGDVNGDSDLDLATGNRFSPNKVHTNRGGGVTEDTSWIPNNPDPTWRVAWGDMDMDGDLDLAVGNDGAPNAVYLNQDGILQTTSPAWTDNINDSTRGLAWGDVDGDGDLDLAVANNSEQNKIYLNNGGILAGAPSWVSDDSDDNWNLAWGDVDGDGDLDLAVAGRFVSDKIYRNDNGTLQTAATAAWSLGDDDRTLDVAWGDVDGDGDLDLAVAIWDAPNRLYLNEGGMLQLGWTDDRTDDTQSVAWGDVDGDGDLDLAVGNGSFPASNPNKIYLNEGGMLQPAPAWESQDSDSTLKLAWGDADGDGDLDLAAANQSAPNKVYFNEGGILQRVAGWQSDDSDLTRSVAWGDVDGDGDLDLAAGNGEGDFEFNKLYRNERPADRFNAGQSASVVLGLASDPVQTFNQFVTALAPADYYAVPGLRQSGKVPLTYTLFNPTGLPMRSIKAFYSPDGGGKWFSAVAADDTITTALAGGPYPTPTLANTHVFTWDVLASGFFGQSDNVVFRLEAYPDLGPQPNGLAGPYQRPYLATQSYPFRVRGSQVRVYSGTVTPGNEVAGAVVYRLPAGRIAGGKPFARGTGDPFRTDNLGYLEGRGQIAISDTLVALLPASKTSCTTYLSDDVPQAISAEGPSSLTSYLSVGQSGLIVDVNVVALSGTHTWMSDLDFNLQGPSGTSVEIMAPSCGSDEDFNINLDDEADPGSWPCTPAPVGGGDTFQPSNPLSAFDGQDSAGVWALTINDSFWEDGGSLDRWGLEICATGLPLYYTSATPVEDGLLAHHVDTLGVQSLAVSAANPLLLFNVDVALEWDAHTDATYLEQLEFDLRRASNFLYDFTDGQVALGDVTVTQNGDDWVSSHVVVHATNSIRPFAAVGGLVISATVDPAFNNIVYDVGQVHMGATWNRYGNAGQSLGEDWPLILAHELSHYLLFLDDTYLGLDSDGLLISVSSCTGSAMGDVYIPANSEFVFDENHWQANCAQTLPARSTGRTEWETLKLWYPELAIPVSANSGPSLIPYDFTTVTILDPITPTDALEDPTFSLDYLNNEVSTSKARAYLLRDVNDDGEFDFVLNLGSPVGGQNRVLARGARPDDRLCVFDPPRQQYGCRIIQEGDDRMAMALNPNWTPLVQLSPVTSVTFQLQVGDLPGGLALQARLYPEYGFGSDIISLTEVAGAYQGTFNLDFPALAGHIQLWVDETADPRQEAIVAYSIGGNPGFVRGGGGFVRGGGGFVRGGGGFVRGGGGFVRGGGAPLLSPDGQMTFFTEDQVAFPIGEFYTVQNMAGLPPLPPGKVAVGQGYSLVATAGAPVIADASVTYQYLGNDVLVEGIDEEELAIHYWNEEGWRILATTVNTYFNLASAPSAGTGIYALLGGVTAPQITTMAPLVAKNDAPTTLVINGQNFLPPVQVVLSGTTASTTLTAHKVTSNTIEVEVPANLPAQEYLVDVISGGEAPVRAPDTFSLFEVVDACFYDFFESGPNQWSRDGQWDVVRLPGGAGAMTDSPGGNYNSAVSPAPTAVTQITSLPFSLSGCPNPLLTLKHDYRLASIEGSQDVARVEISTDDGLTWTELRAFTGGGIYGNQVIRSSTTHSSEWTDPTWQTAEIGLAPYSGLVRLRFSLTVDQDVSDKGWLLDEVLVVAGTVRTTDLQIDLTQGASEPVPAGQMITYTLSLVNKGPDTVDALVSSFWPTNAIASVSSSAACWAAETVQCYFDEFATSQTITIALTTLPAYADLLTTTATITAAYPYLVETDLSNNRRTGTVQVAQPGPGAFSIYLPLVLK